MTASSLRRPGSRPATLVLRALAAGGAALALAITQAGTAAAHATEHAGGYTIEIGWQHEPTYVGESNGVQIIVHDAADKPVIDLAPDDLGVVVTTGTQQSATLRFEPGFDLVEMSGQMGEYDAPLLPTSPGDYTFHLTGAIHGTKVDLTVTSGDATFDTVKGTTDIQFPVQLPSLTELATRLDRIDARLASPAPSAGTVDQAALDTVTAAATDAKSAANQALAVGAVVGGLGILVGLAGVVLALRAGRRRA